MCFVAPLLPLYVLYLLKNGHWTDDGSLEGRSQVQQQQCKELQLVKEMPNCLIRLEQAAEPESLAQETIIHNLAPQEAARLSRVRNIGIAVSCGIIYMLLGILIAISRPI